MKRALRVALVAIAVVAVAMVARRIDLGAGLAALRGLDVGIVALAGAVVLVVKLGAKVGRSQRVLDDVAGVAAPAWPRTAHLVVASHAAGHLAWAPLGITVRSIGLSADGLAPKTIARVHLHERLAELAALVAIGALAVAAAPGAAGPMLARAATAAAVVAAIVAVAATSRRIRAAASPRTLARASAWSLASALADLAVLALAAAAAGVDVAALGPAALLLAFLGLNLACALPVVPAQLGVQEAAIVVALGAAGVAPAPALAAALAYRAAHVVPLALVGLPALASLGLGRPARAG